MSERCETSVYWACWKRGEDEHVHDISFRCEKEARHADDFHVAVIPAGDAGSVNAYRIGTLTEVMITWPGVKFPPRTEASP